MEAATATLNKTLEKILDDLEYIERDVLIKPVSSGGANYTTKLFEVTVTCPGKQTLEFFAKVASLSETARKQIYTGTSETIYDQERYVYQDLASAFSEIELKYNVPLEHRYLFAKLYGCELNSLEETFVMENLTKRKFHIFSRFNTLDWEHASASIRDLAKFNALSMALEKEYPKVFEKIGLTLLHITDVFENIMKGQMQSYKNLVPEEYKSRIENFVANDENLHKLFTTQSGKNVLVHGDYRTSNILYKIQNGRLITIPVDYQTVRLGNPFVDFQFFLAAGSDEKFRKLYYNQLVDYYYSEMGLALKRLGLDIAQEYPRHLFDQDHKFNGRLITIPVDYQTVRLGNPFVDFQFFLAAGSDEKFRKLYYNQLVDYYYSEMGLALKRLGLDIAQEYPRHLFDQDHKFFLPVALVIVLTFLPTFLVHENDAPDMAGETSNYSNFSNVRPNEIYMERLHGYLRDFARWNVI